jgi:hypothetical protein
VRGFVFRRERATQDRLDPEAREEVAAHHFAEDFLRLGPNSH